MNDDLNETAAIFGVLVLAGISLFICKPEVGSQIASNVVSGLIGYIGGRKLSNK